ncbi:biotin--[acetyl-CoA-carboxylase] ligase [Trichlorobacter sp.]|uniref:biotin--[acetyl-CoA-carboxylase] ligase n=1 Tax=Trichlorobacter sp. TaxID=2911007 RepID=UPI002A360092|nr:biotin--[acetyl-CoA-carboxylase] ligase [Trichlorobacter sp.]MDY0383929.1 biotin--[acetyl-CoA-carboxylase] ligase [Trichlorobacter sp.]
MASRLAQSDLLRLLEQAAGFVSGEQLSRTLGVSRTAVWKRIAVLRDAGYGIEALPSQGYRLVTRPDLLSADQLAVGLSSTCLIGQRLVCLDEVGSTNLEAFRLAEAGAVEGTTVLAERQTAGKGRLGRQWVSPGGVNLYLSVVLRPELPPYEAPQLTFLSAVAVARTIEELTSMQPAIKWPNDLLLDNRKVAGLLNEMSAETDRVAFVILGIGVNLNMTADQFPDDLRTPATSLAVASGRPVSRVTFAARLLSNLDQEYARFCASGFGPVRDEWARRCNAFGRQVAVTVANQTLQGPFAGIDHDGALLLRLPDGRLERIMSGDVSVV